jgi:ATP-dependent Clp protease, protease subunit
MRQWYSMKKEEGGAEIVIYDEIGKSFWDGDTITAKKFLEDLSALGDVDSITLRINSPGGDVFDGVAIHNALKNHGAKITAHIDGIAASIASYIAMAASKIVMPSNAFMLIHGASGFVFGNADDMRSTADDLDRIDKSITATYVTRSKSTAAKIKAIMKEDRLMDAAEAKSLGLADEVTSEKKMAASFPLRLLPKAAAERFAAETGAAQEDPPPTAQATESPEPSPPMVPDSTPPEPAPQPTGEVVDLNAARQKGIDEHKAYVSAITDLCILASAAEKVGAYVRTGTPVDVVRKELLEIRAAADVLPHHPLAVHAEPKAASAKTEWGKITDKLNERRKK